MIKAMEGLHNLCHHPYKAMLRGELSRLPRSIVCYDKIKTYPVKKPTTLYEMIDITRCLC